MFTQCPKCDSVFKVSDKDVKAHEGLVRCGNCYSVFNSSWNLTEDPRNDFIESADAPAQENISVSSAAGFTFSIVDRSKDVPAEIREEIEDQDGDETVPMLDSEVVQVEDDALSEEAQLDQLEDFPDPNFAEFEAEEPADAEQDEDELLYFAADDEDSEAQEGEAQEGEAVSGDTADDSSLVQAGEPNLNTLTDDDMWPGEELQAQDEEEFALPPLDESGQQEPGDALLVSEDEEEGVLHEIDLEASGQAEELIVLPQPLEMLTREQEEAWTAPEQPGSSEESIFAPFDESADVEESLPDLDDVLDAAATEANKITPLPEAETADDMLSEPAAAMHGDVEDEKTVAEELEDGPGAESVFITAEDEDLDEVYEPITLKTKAHDGALQDLEEFPEPGELSELNMEDTMQIDAMLEAANISKEQLDTAIASSKVVDDEESEDIEEILLESEQQHDFTGEASAYSKSKDGLDEASQPGGGIAEKEEKKSVFSALRKLVPASAKRTDTMQEPSFLEAEETQLVHSLSRGRGKWLPESLVNSGVVLSTIILASVLLGQIGYFYMDKLVHIGPLTPVLELGCKVAGCKVPAIQSVENIEQLSSSLEKVSDGYGGMKVSSILINNGKERQAYPTLELTLTDRTGNIISRQLISPANYLPSGPPGIALMEPNQAVDINIRFRTPSIRVDGFELRPVRQNWLERSL